MSIVWIALGAVVIADAVTTIIAIRSGAGTEDNFLSAKIMGVFGLVGWALIKAGLSIWAGFKLDGESFVIGSLSFPQVWAVIVVMGLIALNNYRIIRAYRAKKN